jgi:dynein heavy chain
MLQSWLNTLPPGFDDRHKKALQVLFETYIPGAISMLRRTMMEPFPTVNNALVESLLKILDCYFAAFYDEEDEDPIPASAFSEYLDKLESQFIFSLIWSIMTTVTLQGRKIWNSWLRVEMAQNGAALALPEAGMVFDYFYNNETNTWVPWMDTVDAYVYDANLDFSQLIIPTPDSVRYTYLLDLLVTHNKHVIMTGPTGTGKTSTSTSTCRRASATSTSPCPSPSRRRRAPTTPRT